MFTHIPDALSLPHTPEPWADFGSWIAATSLHCQAKNCLGGDCCHFNFYGGELVAESICNPIDKQLFLAAPKMYRAMIYAQQVILEALTNGCVPDDGTVGCALSLIREAADIAQGRKPQLLLAERAAA